MRKTRAHLGAENIREKKNKMEKNKKKTKAREKKKINHAPRCFARTTPTLGTLSREERRRTCLYSLLKRIKGVLCDVRACGKCEEIRIDLSNCRFQCMVSVLLFRATSFFATRFPKKTFERASETRTQKTKTKHEKQIKFGSIGYHTTPVISSCMWCFSPLLCAWAHVFRTRTHKHIFLFLSRS